jgi:ankyrin repeat protein
MKQFFTEIVCSKTLNPDIIECYTDPSIVDEVGKTLLHYAYEYNCDALIKLILKLSPTDKFISHKDIKGKKAEEYALISKEKYWLNKVIKYGNDNLFHENDHLTVEKGNLDKIRRDHELSYQSKVKKNRESLTGIIA